MADLHLRFAQLADAPGIAAVHVAAWQVAYPNLLPQTMIDSLTVEVRTTNWTRWLRASAAGEPTDGSSGPSHRLLVAEEGERIVGWASFGAGRDTDPAGYGELAGLYVHPDHWGSAVGHGLLTAVEDQLRAAGFDNAYLWVLSGNRRAERFLHPTRLAGRWW